MQAINSLLLRIEGYAVVYRDWGCRLLAPTGPVPTHVFSINRLCVFELNGGCWSAGI